jgi:hypothetical protein
MVDLEFVERSYAKKLEALDLKTNLCTRFNHQFVFVFFIPYWHVFQLWHIVIQQNELVFIQISRIFDPFLVANKHTCPK